MAELLGSVFTLSEAGHALGLSARAIRRMIERGKLAVSRLDDGQLWVEGKSLAFALAAKARGSARYIPRAHNKKLSRVDTDPRFRARPPFVAATYASIEATCNTACLFRGNGCFVQTGRTKVRARQLDEAAAGCTDVEVSAEEARLIYRAFGSRRLPRDRASGKGRDLRLHVGGDVGSTLGARLLAAAADDWLKRGGGDVWTYTHSWRHIPRSAWGPIEVLASVETPGDIEIARQRGYPAAITLQGLVTHRAFELPGSSVKIIPCPAETLSRTCVQCRLCLDADGLLERKSAIAFAVHGPGKRKAAQALVQLRLGKNGPLAPASLRSPANASHDAVSSGNKKRDAASGFIKSALVVHKERRRG